MRVLLVEDEVELAATIRDGLTAERIAVDVMHTGPDGLWAAAEYPYDVILLDIMLPGLNGYEVCRQLRAREVWTPILMLTDDYLTKPFSFVVLLARLRALTRRGARERPAILTAGDLSLDPARRRVTRGEQEIAVTAREFALLEFLLRHRGDVVSKRAIIDNVWDMHFDGDDNIVEVYVRYLRRKIDQPYGRASIETVRGAGYRLDAGGG